MQMDIYANGHLCKHVHKVQMMLLLQTPPQKSPQDDDTPILSTPQSTEQRKPGRMVILFTLGDDLTNTFHSTKQISREG